MKSPSVLVRLGRAERRGSEVGHVLWFASKLRPRCLGQGREGTEASHDSSVPLFQVNDSESQDIGGKEQRASSGKSPEAHGSRATKVGNLEDELLNSGRKTRYSVGITI